MKTGENWLNITWDPTTGNLRFAANMDRLTITAILELAKAANIREMQYGGGRPNVDGEVVSGTVRSVALQPRRVDG